MRSRLVIASFAFIAPGPVVPPLRAAIRVNWNAPGAAGELHRNVLYSNVHHDIFDPWVDQTSINRTASVADITGQAPRFASQDPRFASHGPPDPHVLAASPAIDAGRDAVVSRSSRDVDDRLRLLGPYVDLGAYEWGTPSACTLADAGRTLCGGASLSILTLSHRFRLNVRNQGTSFGRGDLPHAALITRKSLGLATNP